eukprot:CAMPEP_0185747040 /NCGR_PEP_ID=MMETSP1174-20130828/5719_1 /TAXON_ID=35687 /ORGANISM="Dictyocha speculum, Strain CCMP1381" /LENGTH=596 /DNA_ID=CAMNT_0028422061 /DNA_START=147 /DNA_END=1937 /DNA_ORIENTATION=+
MTDCTEALVKIKLAFRPGVVDLPEGQEEAPATSINVANFNEFDMQLDLNMPFALDHLPPPDHWISAASQTMARRQDITLMDSEMQAESQLSSTRSRDSLMNEDWAATPFDPRDEHADLGMQDLADEPVLGPDDLVTPGGDGSRNNDKSIDSIEIGRDADVVNSRTRLGLRDLSIDQESASKSVMDTVAEDMEANMDMDLSAGLGDDLGPPMDEDFMQIDPPADSMMGLDSSGQIDIVRDVSLTGGGQEEEKQEDEGKDDEQRDEPTPRSPKARATRKRRLQIDEVTELTTDEIKANLANTDDIVNITFPPRQRQCVLPTEKIPTLEERMYMPNMKGLAPELIEMFKLTMRGNQPLPFKLRPGYCHSGPIQESSAVEVTGDTSAEKKDTDASVDDIETARGQVPPEDQVLGLQSDIPTDFGNTDSLTSPDGLKATEDGDLNMGEDEFQNFPDETFDDPMANMDPLDDELAKDMEDTDRPESALVDTGDFSLGAVNDIKSNANYGDQEENDENRSPASLNWHPHTTKVHQMLEKQFEKKNLVSYNEVTGLGKRKVGRRTAAGVFFELLQLKTWDLIEVNQANSYGDIVVSKGPRFDSH